MEAMKIITKRAVDVAVDDQLWNGNVGLRVTKVEHEDEDRWQGKGGTVAAGACPLPMGGPSGGGDVTFGWNSAAPGISNYDNVLH